MLLSSESWLLVVGSLCVGADCSSLRWVYGLDIVVLVMRCYFVWGVVGWWGPFMYNQCCCGYQCGGIHSCDCMFVFCCGFVVQFMSVLMLIPVDACWCFLCMLGWVFVSV